MSTPGPAPGCSAGGATDSAQNPVRCLLGPAVGAAGGGVQPFPPAGPPAPPRGQRRARGGRLDGRGGRAVQTGVNVCCHTSRSLPGLRLLAELLGALLGARDPLDRRLRAALPAARCAKVPPARPPARLLPAARTGPQPDARVRDDREGRGALMPTRLARHRRLSGTSARATSGPTRPSRRPCRGSVAA